MSCTITFKDSDEGYVVRDHVEVAQTLYDGAVKRGAPSFMLTMNNGNDVVIPTANVRMIEGR